MVWLQALPPALCYFLFNWQFFRCVECVHQLRPLGKRSIIYTFIINYGVFILCSMLNLHLIVNWIVFLFLLLGEQVLLYRQPVGKCALFALLGTQLGLAVNILFRSLLAITLDIPLIAFDNSVMDPENMKRYPVLLGFLAAGLLFLLVARFDLLKRLHLVTGDRSTLVFLLCLLVAMYFYLCMNLMVYYIQENDPIFKVWSMKSSVFVIVGECLAIILSIRLGQISEYRARSQRSQEQLVREQERELELLEIAATDPLTGCENRLQAEARLKEATAAGRGFSLCFVDMNRLKAVNDRYGHEMGDKYIQAVVGALGRACRRGDHLFRYGGDEFLLLLFDTAPSEAGDRLRRAQQELDGEAARHGWPFAVGISYGIAAPSDGADGAALIKAADERMYQMKHKPPVV